MTRATRPGRRGVFDFVLTGALAILAAMWALVLPRSLARRPGRLGRLYDQITGPTG